MLLIPQLGSYLRKRRRGYVAEYCPRCLDAVAFRFHEVLKYLTIWSIPIPPGYVCGHEVHCTRCKIVIATDESRYGPPVKERNLPLDRLIQRTHPGLWDELERRERLKTRAYQGAADEAEKVTAIAEIIAAYEDQAAKRADEINIEGWGTAMFVLMVLAPLITFVLDGIYRWPIGLMGKVVLAQEAVLLPLLIYFIMTDARRFCHRRLLPKMLPGIHQFHPDDREIRAALRDLGRLGLVIGRKLDPGRVTRAYQRFVQT